jgi:hypothetical protein
MTNCTLKTFVTLLLWSSILAARSEDQVQIVRHGTNVNERPSPALVTNAVALVRSCLSPNYFPIKAETWQEFERSDSFVLVTFASPSTVTVKITDGYWMQGKFKFRFTRDEIMDQILVPLPDGAPGPAFIFVKSGTNVLSFSKWDPQKLGMVGCEPALHMSSRHYKALADINPNK